MRKFVVDEAVFQALPDVCFGVVIAKGIDNTASYPAVDALLQAGVAAIEQRFMQAKVKEDEAIRPYREAFEALHINPNKFLSSIEAMLTRVSKGKGLPSINPIVDAGNALCLKYILPMGAHDIAQMDADVEVRFSKATDTFLPFGETQLEHMPAGELVYAVGARIRTRRWIWRQSEIGKIGPASSDIFFPIDGFLAGNRQAVMDAREELAALAEDVLGAKEVRLGFVDKNSREVLL